MLKKTNVIYTNKPVYKTHRTIYISRFMERKKEKSRVIMKNYTGGYDSQNWMLIRRREQKKPTMYE